MSLKRKLSYCALLAGDIFFMYLSLFLALALRSKGLPTGASLWIFVYHFSILYIVFGILLFALDFYEIRFFKNAAKFNAGLIVFFVASIFTGVAYFYFQPELLFAPKTVLVLDVILFILFFYGWRSFFTALLFKNFKEKMVVVGFPRSMSAIVQNLARSNYSVACFFIPEHLRRENVDYFSQKVVFNVSELKHIIVEQKIRTMVVTEDFYTDKTFMRQIFSDISTSITVLNFSEFYEILTKRVSLDALDDVWFLEKLSRSKNKAYDIVKRVIDVLLSIFFLVITLIVFLPIAIAIKIDSTGPVLYSQKRVGKSRKVFTVYKFRTMTHVQSQEEKLWREAKKGAVTRLGAFLRRFHLDELPQCMSILKGDLSFVGPRPEWIYLAEMFEKEIPFYYQRYLVKPGFTGWAQINFPPSGSIVEAQQKFEYDLYYIKNRSLLLDAEIVLKTIRLILWL